MSIKEFTTSILSINNYKQKDVQILKLETRFIAVNKQNFDFSGLPVKYIGVMLTENTMIEHQQSSGQVVVVGY